MLKWLVRIVVGVVALAVVVVAGGAAFEAVSRGNAAKTYPAPGRLVDIGGGHRLQLDCRGAGTPVVVFESGLDSLGALSWTRVHDAVAATTRACAYSRAGVMWSDAAGHPFTSTRAADDLHKALAAAGEKPPYVMVGHSLGGPYVLTYTARYPNDVAGLVFVDASHPDQLARLRAANDNKEPEGGAALARTADTFAWTGVVRLMVTRDTILSRRSPPQIVDPALAYFPASLQGLVAEGDAIPATLAAAGHANGSAPHPLGDRPLVVLTHGLPYPPAALKQMKITPAQAARLDAAWLAMQDQEAGWSTHSRHAVIEHAGHYIQFDDPAAVVAAVRDVVGQVRQGQTPPTPPAP